MPTKNAGGKGELLYTIRNANLSSHCRNWYGGSSKTKSRITIRSSCTTPGYISERVKGTMQEDTYTPMFIAALFTIAKLFNQSRWLSTDGWIKKMWYMYTIEHYSSIKKNKIMSFLGKQIESEIIC
jgi:hypothetical protein